MSDFSFSATIGAPPVNDASGTLWSFNGVRMLAGPAGSVILHKLRGDRRMIVQPDVADAMRLCGPFRTLDAHARSIMKAMPALKEHAEHTLQTLRGLAEAGLLESSETAWERLTLPAGATDTDAPCRVFILTCDRPAALNRLLSGLREYPLPDAVEGIWIVDDSRQAENIQENQSIIEAQAEGATVPVVHVDPIKRGDLIQQLKTALPEHSDSIEWLLERSVWSTAPTYGIARNLALLLSVGKRALVLDDDIIPQAIAPPLSSTDLRFGTANDREAVFYASQEALTQHALPLPDSPLAMMLSSLGQTLGTLIPRHLAGHGALRGFDGEFLTRRDAHSRVMLSQCGTWGDAGTGTSGNWIFHLPSATIKKLLEAQADISALLDKGSNWFGYRGPTVTGHGIMAAVTGLDHRALLPPYLPAGRGEDILFGIMLQRLHPESGVWNEGWAIRHEPIDTRQGRGALTPLSVKPGISLLADWLGREPRDQWGLAPENRLSGLADQLQRLASMHADSLESLVQQELVSKRSVLLGQCMVHLGGLTGFADLLGSEEWQHFLEQSRDQLVKQLQTPEPEPLTVLGDSGEGMGSSQLTALRNHGANFAEALDAWLEICVAAKDFEAT